ncbi:MAG: hypothetical protein MJ213_01375 [Bacilli bacterium]|nr:hypothetical protein [Bacilli bacterium]
MNKKQPIVWQNIKRNFVMYLAILLIFPLVVLYFGNLRIQIDPKHKFGVFLGFNSESVQGEKLYKDLKAVTDNYEIKELNVWRQSPQNSEYQTYVMSYGIYNSDILIIPQYIYTDNWVKSYLCECKSNYGRNTYLIDGIRYGIETYNHESKEACFTEYVTYDMDVNYHIFISSNSVHFQDYKEKGNSIIDTVIKWMVQ